MDIIFPLKVALSAFVLIILLKRLHRSAKPFSRYSENLRATAGALVLVIALSIIWSIWY